MNKGARGRSKRSETKNLKILKPNPKMLRKFGNEIVSGQQGGNSNVERGASNVGSIATRGAPSTPSPPFFFYFFD
jgi:hypothetical protein